MLAPLTARAAAMMDAADMIENHYFLGRGLFSVLEAGSVVITAIGTTISWIGGTTEWSWVFCYAFLGTATGLFTRWLLKKLIRPDHQRSIARRILFWLSVEASYFAAGMIVFTSLPAWARIHGLALTIFLACGTVCVMRSMTRGILAIGGSSNVQIIRQVGFASAVVAFGYIVLGLMRLAGTPQPARIFIGFIIWIIFLTICALMVQRFATVTTKWRATDIVTDPVSTLLLQQRPLFFGTMICVLGVATVVSAISNGPQAYGDGIFSIALLGALPTIVAAAPKVVEHFYQRIGPWQQTLVRCFRLLVFVAFWLILASIWNINPFAIASTQLGERVGVILIDVCIAIALAYVLWSVARTALDMVSLPERPALPGEHDAIHSGNYRATRIQTFVPLLRAVTLSFVVAATVMISLAAMGVNIGPLLAGAGIIGVAIGFGSQALVKDVISGIFFLADDAFRIGEWVEVSSAKGTVEAITIRSLKLRHSRGALYTVPFGSINMVNNQSRDYTILKLEFLVAFDSDLVQAKKIIKQIDAELTAHPEIGESLLQPIKFQGVRRMDQYGLVVGVKFTAKPGEQWTLRREVYQRVRDGFHKVGIEFARPQVTVKVPDGNMISHDTLEQAAASILLENKPEEEEPKKK